MKYKLCPRHWQFFQYRQSLHINLYLVLCPRAILLQESYIELSPFIRLLRIMKQLNPEMKLVYFKKKLSTKTLNYIGVAYCLSCSNHFGDVNDLTVSFWQFIWHFFWDLQSETIKLLPLHEIPSGTEIAMGAMFCLNCLLFKHTRQKKGKKSTLINWKD